MSEPLAFATAVVCCCSAILLLFGLLGTRRWRMAVPIMVTVQFALVVQAVLDAVSLLGGHRVGELTTHLAYLVTSLVVLPAAAGQTWREDGPWAVGLRVVALLVVAVIVVRMQATWRSPA